MFIHTPPKPLIIKLLAGICLCSAIGGCTSPDNAENIHGPGEQRMTINSMYEDYREDFDSISEVTPADVADAYHAGELLIVDVRPKKERAVSMIPGAISKEEFEANLDTYSSKRIVAHCTIGYRSGIYVKELGQRGIAAENLVGSLLLWAHEGLPLEEADGNPTKRVHVYGKQWDLLPEGYEPVW